MKAWVFYDDDGGCVAISAETRGQAFAKGADVCGMTFRDAVDGRCRVSRFPALDGQTFTDWDALKVGAYHFLYCVVCEQRIYCDPGNEPYSGDYEHQAFPSRSGSGFCSAACRDGVATPSKV